MTDSIGTINCPSCDRAASVVWAKSRNDTMPPLCKSCFYRHLAEGPAQPTDFTQYYLPEISHNWPLWVAGVRCGNQAGPTRHPLCPRKRRGKLYGQGAGSPEPL